MVSHRPVKFVAHRHCDCGDITLVVQEEDSTCSRLTLICMKYFCNDLHKMGSKWPRKEILS